MVFHGRVQGGVIVPDSPVALPEGAQVRIEFVESAEEEPLLDEHGQTLGQRLLKFAGKAKGELTDLAHQHDHYLYGTPKK